MINERKAGVVNMDPSIVGAFWLVSMLFILTPGADWAYAIAAGIREHRVAPAVNGMLIGHTLAIIIVAAGGRYAVGAVAYRDHPHHRSRRRLRALPWIWHCAHT